MITITIEVTYAALTALIASSGLKSGINYRITDYKTVHTIIGTSDVHEGLVEPLTVKAISPNEISNIASSLTYPNDIIHYNYINNQAAVLGCTKGYIYRRIDTLQYNDFGFDFRNVTFRRWQINVPNWSGATLYSLGTAVKDPSSSNIYISISASNSMNAVTDTAYWRLFEWQNLSYVSPNSGSWTLACVDLGCTDLPCTALFQDYHMWADPAHYASAKNNTILSDTISGLIYSNNTVIFGAGFLENTIGASFSYNSIGALFQWNKIGRAFENNSIGSIFRFNVVGGGFMYNTVGSSFVGNVVGDGVYANAIGTYFGNNFILSGFQNNSIGDSFGFNNIAHDFQMNSIGNSFKNNAVGNNFQMNTIGHNGKYNIIQEDVMSNIIGNSFSTNTIGNNFASNTIGSNFNNNAIGNSFFSNIIGNNFNNNNILNGFASNTIGNAFQYNNGKIYFIDFTTATLVYLSYTKTFSKKPDGTFILSYINNSNVLTFVLPTA